MTVNLSLPHSSHKRATSLSLTKHKVTINLPKQTHFNIQGVQIYTSQQLKALKKRGDALYGKKQGVFLKPKLVLLSDQVIEFDDVVDPLLPVKKKQPKTGRSKSAKLPMKHNLTSSTSITNQSIFKPQKQKLKKDNLQIKIQNPSKRFKKHFEGVQLKDTVSKIQLCQKQFLEEENVSIYQPSINDNQSKNMRKTENQTYDRSSKANKEIQQFQQINFSMNHLQLIRRVMEKSAYSEKMGNVVQNLFY